MSNKIVPITILTGYLGAGKTTLLNHVLNNQDGYKVAVIVNDIGEVNIDADLIGKGGIVKEEDDSLVALENGCICCTLKENLMNQILKLVASEKFNYILIECSGVSEPLPIVQTISAISDQAASYGLKQVCRLDNVVSVVDAYRFATEFGCGENLVNDKVDEEDIESLLIQQIEFCNRIIINKVDTVSKEELDKVKAVIKKLQPKAEMIEAVKGNVPVSKILDTNSFDFEEVATSVGWLKEFEEHHENKINDECECHHEEDEHECHCHEEGQECHCHEHHHKSEDYGIGSFVYCRRKPFNKEKFKMFVQNMPKSIIRSKGLAWYSDDYKNVHIFEQAGKQISSYEAGRWVASFSKRKIAAILEENPHLGENWDDVVGDRMIKLVFIGQKMNEKEIINALDNCLE